MRSVQWRSNAFQQRLIRQGVMGKDPTALLLEPAAADAVQKLHGRMGGQAGPDAGSGVGLRPLQELAQALPVGLIAQQRRDGLRPRDDERIGRLPVQLIDRPIPVTIDMHEARGSSWYFR